jgi:hypothetical protein
MMKAIVPLFFLAANAAASAFTLEGELLDGGAPANGMLPMRAELLDATAATLWSEDAQLIVVGGRFVVEIGAVLPPPSEALLVANQVRLTLDGEVLSSMPLPTSTRAVEVERARLARMANTAQTVGGVDPAQLLTTQNLSSANIGIRGITGLPSGVADDDQGTALSAQSPLQLMAGALSLGQLTGASILDRSVTGGVIATGASAPGTATTIGANVTSSAIADGTITSTMLTGLGPVDFAQGPILYRLNPDCGVGESFTSVCYRTPASCDGECDRLIFRRLRCEGDDDGDNDVCECVSALVNPNDPCNNTPIARLVAP